MSNVNFFENSYAENVVSVQDPFFTTKNKSKQELLKWLENEVVYREAYHSDFFRTCQINLQAYSNNYFKKAGRQSDSLERNGYLNKRTSKYCVNNMYEMTENLVSKMTRLKPAVEVLPSNDEFDDKASARAVKLLIKHLWYINNVDFMIQKVHRHRIIFGNSYIETDWDKNIGDLHPDYIKLRDKNKLNALGLSDDDTPIRVGDVYYKTRLPWHLLLEHGNCYEDTKTIILKDLVHIESLKNEFPEKANEIKLNKSDTRFNMGTLKHESIGKYLWVYTLIHKADQEFPKGRRVKFIKGLILKEGDLNLSHGEFPILRLTDIDVPGQLHGLSRYQQALILQNSHNNLSQSIMKNEFLMGAPKWLMPRGACKLEQLSNGRTIIQYQGNIAPELKQMNPTSVTTFNFRDKIDQELGKIMGVHAVSRGEPPKGITAAVALQFLNEQENERAMSDIAKHNNFIVDLAKHSISVAGDNYKVDDGRMLRILGKENKYLIKSFDSANLHKDYDVRIQNSSALPQSKSARMERIIQTMQYLGPEMFQVLPKERWAELLEFGSTEKMHTLLTEAITAAESEEEDILEGNPVDEPKEWEDHLAHLPSHYKKVQSRSFKEEVPPERQAAMITHIKTTEMLAAQKAAQNPLYLQKLMAISAFPMFWKHDLPQMPIAPEEGENNES